MKYIKLGAVRAFLRVAPDKPQALKVLEEAAEVFGAWQLMRDTEEARLNPKHEMTYLMDEIADTIQACCNLAAALGVEDMTPYLARCEERNRERGRYGEGEPK